MAVNVTLNKLLEILGAKEVELLLLREEHTAALVRLEQLEQAGREQVIAMQAQLATVSDTALPPGWRLVRDA